MSTYRQKGSRFYSYDFQINRCRFHGPTGCTTKRAADEFERELKAEKKREQKAPTDTLNAVAGKWWLDRGQHRKDAGDVEYRLERILLALGAGRPATSLTQANLADYVAARRAQPIKGALRGRRRTAPATINREIEVMRAAWRYAIKRGALLPMIDWSAERLAEPETRERVLTIEEEEQIFAEIRADYAPLFAAMIETGWRWGTAAHLRWRDLRGDVIESEGKGGRMIRTPVTPFLRTLVEAQRGNHPDFIWTFAAQVTRWGRVRGQRYPMVYSAARAEWERACAAAGVGGANIHQLRHTAATRMLRETGNLVLVQRLLGHTRITTTVRYAHSADDDLRAAMSSVRESRNESRKSGPVAAQEVEKKR